MRIYQELKALTSAAVVPVKGHVNTHSLALSNGDAHYLGDIGIAFTGDAAELARVEAVLREHRERMAATPHLFPDWVLERTEPRRFDPTVGELEPWAHHLIVELPCGHFLDLAAGDVPECDCDQNEFADDAR